MSLAPIPTDRSIAARPLLTQVQRRPGEVRTPGRPWSGVRRIVVARHDRLGDVIVSLPAVAALRRAYPEARLALMVQSALAPLARMVDGVDEVLVATAGHAPLLHELSRFRPDLVVSISRGCSIPWAAARARVPHRVGPGYRFYSPLFHRSVREHRREGLRHEVEYALSFAHRAGAPAGEAAFLLRVPERSAEEVARWAASHDVPPGFIVLHPGSGGSCPGWPLAHYLGLAELLSLQAIPVAFSLGPADAAVARRLEQAAPHVRRLPRFGGDLPATAALLRRAAFAVGNSTGPLHLAAALDVPTLTFHAPWPSCGVSRWGPYAANGWALVAESHEARRWSRRERRLRAPSLMACITPEIAASCLRQLLQAR